MLWPAQPAVPRRPPRKAPCLARPNSVAVAQPAGGLPGSPEPWPRPELLFRGTAAASRRLRYGNWSWHRQGTGMRTSHPKTVNHGPAQQDRHGKARDNQVSGKFGSRLRRRLVESPLQGLDHFRAGSIPVRRVLGQPAPERLVHRLGQHRIHVGGQGRLIIHDLMDQGGD